MRRPKAKVTPIIKAVVHAPIYCFPQLVLLCNGSTSGFGPLSLGSNPKGTSMKIYILVFLFQVMFNIFKTLEIKYTYEHRVKELMLNSIWINLVSLGSMYFAIDSLLKGNWSVIIVYIAGSVVGKWVAMEKINDYREKLFRLFKKNRHVL